VITLQPADKTLRVIDPRREDINIICHSQRNEYTAEKNYSQTYIRRNTIILL